MDASRCTCPGRVTISNIGAVKKNVKIDAVHLSNCMVKVIPMCKNHDFDQFKEIVENKFGVKCVLSTHAYD
jgi:predicted metal-binding protein